MNSRIYSGIAAVLFLSVVLLASACGTLQIDTESAVAEPVDPESVATEAPQATPAINQEDAAAEGAEPTADLTPTPAESTAEAEGPGETSPTATRRPDLAMLDDTWLSYTSRENGFSINIPRTMIHMYGSCKWSEENGDHSYRPELAYVPVAIFEDGDTVYISSDYYHVLGGETRETSADGGTRAFFSDCQAVTNSLELLRDPENHFQQKWAIVTVEIHDDEELDAFIKDRYGPGCSLGEKAPSGQEGVFDISIQGDGLDLEQTQCPINFATVVKYFPAGSKVGAWDRGQSYHFPADVNYSVTYDQEMEDSFRFLTGPAAEAPTDAVAYDYTGWLPYANETLGYSLMYPGQADIMGANRDEAVEFVGPIVGDDHWPWLFVQHFNSEFYSPPAGTDVRQWIADSNISYKAIAQDTTIGGLPAVRLPVERSQQAYAMDEYYVIDGDQLYKITILHAADMQDWELYEQFLASISFSEGS
ncbi:MAG: hypothetical protein JSW55_19990 [Chloroflexota bacterium]|nr:MAG: hypothetical protein JSW55_19990 [Chloroflexota bacterium]